MVISSNNRDLAKDSLYVQAIRVIKRSVIARGGNTSSLQSGSRI